MSFTIHEHHICRIEDCLKQGTVKILFHTPNEKSHLISVGIKDGNIIGWSKSYIEDAVYCEKFNGELHNLNTITSEILICCTMSTLWNECSFVGTVMDDKGNAFHVFQRRLGR